MKSMTTYFYSVKNSNHNLAIVDMYNGMLLPGFVCCCCFEFLRLRLVHALLAIDMCYISLFILKSNVELCLSKYKRVYLLLLRNRKMIAVCNEKNQHAIDRSVNKRNYGMSENFQQHAYRPPQQKHKL